MFTYLDPAVRRKLIERGQLRRINADGQPLDVDEKPDSSRLSVNLLGPIPLPMTLADWEHTFQWYAAVRNTELSEVERLAKALREAGGQHKFAEMASSMAVNSVLTCGDWHAGERPLVRVHSSCMTGDVFGSQRCECGPQLASALQRIAEHPSGGMLIYMAGHEGRGIGLWAKAATYLLQDDGEDTYQANRSLGLPDDSRDFSEAAAILKHFFGEQPFDVLTNNPKKINDLKRSGLQDIRAIKHVAGVSDWNRKYLSAKAEKGHDIAAGDLQQPPEPADD
ncbi:MAG: GTP cyclohydrolase II [Pseudomonadota bacterium]